MTTATSKIRRLVALLRPLNTKQIPIEELERHASKLLLTAGFAAINNLPRAQMKGGATARKELNEAMTRAVTLATSLRGFHSEAMRAVEKTIALQIKARKAPDTLGGQLTQRDINSLHPVIFKTSLIDFINVLSIALECVPATPSRKGRLPKVQARQVTIAACELYTTLTGRKVGRATDAHRDGCPAYGPLHDFLRAAYDILGVNADADGQLKSLLSPPRGKISPK